MIPPMTAPAPAPIAPPLVVLLADWQLHSNVITSTSDPVVFNTLVWLIFMLMLLICFYRRFKSFGYAFAVDTYFADGIFRRLLNVVPGIIGCLVNFIQGLLHSAAVRQEYLLHSF